MLDRVRPTTVDEDGNEIVHKYKFYKMADLAKVEASVTASAHNTDRC